MLRKTSLHRKGERNGEPQREPCLSCTVHLSAPEKASKPFPRISIRNGFTRPTGDINVNSPLHTKRPSREEILTENLCDLPSPPVGRRPLSITLHSRAQYTSDSPCRVKRTAPSTIPHLSQISRAKHPYFARSS